MMKRVGDGFSKMKLIKRSRMTSDGLFTHQGERDNCYRTRRLDNLKLIYHEAFLNMYNSSVLLTFSCFDFRPMAKRRNTECGIPSDQS